MKRTAGFLKVIATIVLVFEVIIAMTVTAGGVIVALAGSFSELADKTGDAITVSGNVTPAELDAFKPVILIALAAGLVALILTIIGTLKTRTALNECKQERPFSKLCADSMKISARMEVLAGLVGIIAGVVIAFMARSLTVNGVSPGNYSVSISLSFVFYAVQKYLLYHIANYGHSLERDPRRR